MAFLAETNPPPPTTQATDAKLAALSTGLIKVTTGTGALSTGVAGTDYAAPNTRAQLFSLATSKLGTSALADVFSDWELQNWSWQVAGTGGVTVDPGAPGALRLFTGNSGSAYPKVTAYHVVNLRTSRWIMASRYRFITAGAAHQLFWGLQAVTTTTARVGIGFDGAASVAKCYAGMFTGTLPDNTRAAASVISTKGPNAAYTTAYLYNDGANIMASLDGEAEFVACAAADVPSETGYLLPALVGMTGASSSTEAHVDWTFLATER